MVHRAGGEHPYPCVHTAGAPFSFAHMLSRGCLTASVPCSADRCRCLRHLTTRHVCALAAWAPSTVPAADHSVLHTDCTGRAGTEGAEASLRTPCCTARWQPASQPHRLARKGANAAGALQPEREPERECTRWLPRKRRVVRCASWRVSISFKARIDWLFTRRDTKQLGCCSFFLLLI